MIDVDWLKNEVEYGFYYDPGSGDKVLITGFLAVGTESVVFEGKYQGKDIVMKTPRDRLGFHIRELPIWLTETPKYDLNRLNQKLLRLVGNPLFDTMNHPYNNLYITVLRHIDAHGVLPMLLAMPPAWAIEFFPLLLHTPSMKLRLQDEISSNERVSNETREALEIIDKIPLENNNLQPEHIADNPLYIWGAAVMDGFFTDEELPQAVAFIQAHYGRLMEHPNMMVFLDQIFAIAHLLAAFTPSADVKRLTKFCALAGFLFSVEDMKGKRVS